MHACYRKHKCKRKHVPTAPCDDCLSEYRNTYVRKPIGPPKSCKPDQTPMMSDVPAEDKTTTRYHFNEYIILYQPGIPGFGLDVIFL